MSVEGIDVAKFFPISGQADPRLPLGRWAGSGSVVGDGGGGTAEPRLILAGANAVIGLVFSVDYVSGSRSDAGVDTTALVQILASSFDPEVVLTTWGFPVDLVAMGGASYVDAAKIQFPLYMGTRRRSSSDPTAVTVFFPTNTNLITYAVQAHGHYWSFDSLRLPGGPLRPEVAAREIQAVPGGQSYYDRLRAGALR